MKRNVAIVIALVLAGSGSGRDLFACGDKFLVPGRGVRFERTPAERQASTLLIYAPPASGLSRALGKLKVDPSIRKVGYRPTVVTTDAELDRAAGVGRWDVVLTDLTDGAAVSQRFRTMPLTHVIVVTPPLTRVQAAQTRAQFPWLLKSPARAQDFLDAIDNAGVCAREDASKLSRKGH